MTFEDIRKANDLIKTTAIKGKEYAEVNQRIKAFRSVYPEGYILTEIVSDTEGTEEQGRVCVMRATVGYYKDGEPVTLATGTAYEVEKASYINKTSYLENCETSAVGRALGMIGFGIDTSVASFEEVNNAITHQAEFEKIGKIKARALAEKCNKEGVNLEMLMQLNKVAKLEDLTERQHASIIKNWAKVRERC